MVFQIYVSDQKFEDSINLLLLIDDDDDDDKSHYVYIKDFNRFMFHKTKNSTFLIVLLTKLFVLMISLPNQLLFVEVKMLLMNLLKQLLKSMSTAKK